MTAANWIALFRRQSRDFNKSVFTITELTALSQIARSSLLVQLSRLTKAGVFVRCGHGLYGAAERLPEQVVGHLDAAAYCTGLYALFRHGFVTQLPAVVTCFTNKRHGRSRIMHTRPYAYEFVMPAARIYRPPAAGALASPEQAFCDFVYVCRNRGFSPAGVITFRKLAKLNKKEIIGMLENYPATVREEAINILEVAR
jgi:hypothetical protein